MLAEETCNGPHWSRKIAKATQESVWYHPFQVDIIYQFEEWTWSTKCAPCQEKNPVSNEFNSNYLEHLYKKVHEFLGLWKEPWRL